MKRRILFHELADGAPARGVQEVLPGQAQRSQTAVAANARTLRAQGRVQRMHGKTYVCLQTIGLERLACLSGHFSQDSDVHQSPQSPCLLI